MRSGESITENILSLRFIFNIVNNNYLCDSPQRLNLRTDRKMINNQRTFEKLKIN